MNIIIEQFIDNMLRELDIRYSKITQNYYYPNINTYNIYSPYSVNYILIQIHHTWWSMVENYENMGSRCFNPPMDTIIEWCSKYMPMRKL